MKARLLKTIIEKQTIILQLILGIFLIFFIESQIGNFSFKIAALLIVVFLIFLLSVILINKSGNKKKRIETMFLLFSVIIGPLYMISIPIGNVPDERNHFLRSYEIATGHMTTQKRDDVSVGRYMPENLDKIFNDVYNTKYSDEISNIKIHINSKKAFFKFGNTALYSPVSYIPQALGVLLGTVLNLPVLIIAYLGRIFNYLVYVLIMYFTIKNIPILKRTIFMLAFMPIMMQEAISLSPDALVNATSFAFIAYIIYSIYNKNKKITKKESILIIIMTIILALSKIVYLPLVLLLFLIPKTRFNNKKNKLLFTFILLILAAGLNLSWLSISSKYLIEYNPGVNSLEQVKYILYNPIRYCFIIFNTFNLEIIILLSTFVGSHLEWLSVYLSQPLMFIYLFIIIYYAFNENQDSKIKIVEKLVFLLVAIIIVLLTCTSLYVQWTNVGNLIINGLQGRYFIPISLIFVLLMNSKSVIFKKQINERLMYTFSIFISIYSIITIFINHI